MEKVIILIVFSLLLEVSFCYTPRTCKGEDDCAPHECCVVGMNRYSTPQCMALGQAYEDCLMENEPENKTLAYPNEVVDVYGVYRLMCPCAESLMCVHGKCS